jgi:hypothetical protein
MRRAEEYWDNRAGRDENHRSVWLDIAASNVHRAKNAVQDDDPAVRPAGAK